jgi:tetratricopeptide (TPR) repeat protein
LKKSPQELLAATFQLLSAGRLEEARRACRKALQLRPDLPDGHLLFSEIHHQTGDAAKARESASRALKLRPGWSEAYVALGNAEALAGNLQAAEAHFRSAIAAGSPGAGVYANLGHVLMRQERLQEAREAYERGLSLDPNALELQLNVASALVELGDRTGALERLAAAAERFPDSARAHFALGNALADLGRNAEALPCYGRALELEPSFWAALFNQARALFAAGRNDEAIAALHELLGHDPRAGEPREQLLRVLQADRRFAEMERVAREGMAIDSTAMAYPHQLGVALWWQKRHDEALSAFEIAERVAQDRTSAPYLALKLDQALSLLAVGRRREGWAAYRHRATRIAWRARFPLLVDDPSVAAGLDRPARILIVGEQGLGDDLFFLRFAASLAERGHRLVGCFDSRLMPLLAEIPGMFAGLSSTDDPAQVEVDVTMLSGDLPLATGRELAPPLALRADPARSAKFEALLSAAGRPPYIGVTWRAGALPDERKKAGVFYLTKEIPPEDLGAALRPLGATICVLQRRPAAEDRERFVAALGRPAVDLSAVNDDLRDALAALSVLDDYVGVSNTNTHLRAGCAGKPARVLVSPNPEWRWGLAGERSQWFPEFVVYRQEPGGGWAAALRALQSDLSAALAA